MTYLQNVAILLDLSPSQKDEVLRELKSHIASIADELIESGMDQEQARSEAEKRMGPPEDIASRLNSSNNTASWQSAICCALPFFAWAVLSALPGKNKLYIIISTLCGIAALALCIRELKHKRQPLWISSGLAFAVCNTGIVPLPTTIALIAAYIADEWKKQVVILFAVQCICLVGCILMSRSKHMDVLIVSITLAILIGVSIAIFVYLIRSIADIKYVTAMHGSLFLFSLFVVLNIFAHQLAMVALCKYAVIGVLVLLLARASKRIEKEKFLNCGIIVQSIASYIFTDTFSSDATNIFFWITASLNVLLSVFIAQWIIFLPLRNEDRINNEIPPIAFE